MMSYAILLLLILDLLSTVLTHSYYYLIVLSDRKKYSKCNFHILRGWEGGKNRVGCTNA